MMLRPSPILPKYQLWQHTWALNERIERKKYSDAETLLFAQAIASLPKFADPTDEEIRSPELQNVVTTPPITGIDLRVPHLENVDEIRAHTTVNMETVGELLFEFFLLWGDPKFCERGHIVDPFDASFTETTEGVLDIRCPLSLKCVNTLSTTVWRLLWIEFNRAKCMLLAGHTFAEVCEGSTKSPLKKLKIRRLADTKLRKKAITAKRLDKIEGKKDQPE